MNSFLSVYFYYDKNVHKSILYPILFMIGIFAVGCAPSAGIFKITENNKNITVVSNKVYETPNHDSVDVSEYMLPKSTNVKEIDYNDSLKSILIKYSDGDEGGFLFYNLAENKIVWTAKSDMSFNLMQDNDLLLRDPQGGKLYDAISGKFIRKTESYLYFLGNGKTLMLSPDTFALVDVRNGERIWKQQGHEWEGTREVYENNEWIYVIAGGLHALNLVDGSKWEYLTPNSWKNVGKELARQTALACLTMGRSYSAYQPDITMNMNSQPLVVENVIFFAARDKMVCLAKTTGKLLWEIKIDPELEEMILYDISKTEVALIGTGMKIVNFAKKLSDPPTVRIIRKDDGKITSLFRMDKNSIVQSFSATNEKYFLLTPSQLLIFNKDLKLLGVIETKTEYGNFVNLLATGDTLVLRTSKGLAALSSDSLTEVWFQYCEVPPVKDYDEWLKAFYEKNKINNNSLFIYDYYWTPNENNGITTYDIEKGREIMKLELFGKNIKRYDAQRIVDFDENKIKIITFK